MPSCTNTPNANAVYDSPTNMWCTAVQITKGNIFTLPIARDNTAKIYKEQFVINPQAYSPLDIGTNHSTLKRDLVGTVSITSGTDVVLGSGTTFTSTLLAGDYITLNGTACTIETVDSDSQLTLVDLYGGTTLTNATAQQAAAYLVSEEGQDQQEDGLLMFTRVYATVPADRTDYTTTSYNYPAYRTLVGDTGNADRSAFSQTVVASVQVSYVRTNNPNTLTFTQPFTITNSSGDKVQAVAQDTTPTRSTYEGYVTAGTLIQASETRIALYRGNIWRLEDIKVQAR